MSEYVVTDTELTAVANAIRTKGGTSASLEWNADFISAINAISGGGGEGDALLKTVKIWTHSTGGQDASLYAQEFTWDGETLTAVGSPMDISFWPFYNHEYEYLDLFGVVRLSYSTPNWVIKAITDVIYNGSVIISGSTIASWGYQSNSTCFVIYDMEGGAKNILSGTSAPSASKGSNGDMYLQYIDVPSGYTLLDYIQSTGTQYIDTGVNPDSDTAVEVDFFDYSFNGDTFLYGYRPNSWNGGVGINNNGLSNMFLYFGGENNAGRILPMVDGKIKLENGKRTVNGSEAAFTPVTISYNYPIYIFATNNNGTAAYFGSYKLRSLKIWDDDVLIRDFIPCKRDSDDAVGLYDLVNSMFYANSGTGSFTSGNEMTDDCIKSVYLKVNGSWQSLIGQDIDDVNTEGGGEELDFYAINYNPESNGNSSRSAGWRFTTTTKIKVKGIRFFARETIANVYISDSNGNTIASKTNVTVIADQWNDVLFDNPITLSANTTYVVWGSHSTIAMKYAAGSKTSAFLTYVGGCYSTSFSTFPSTNDYATYGVDLILAFNI